MTTSINKWISSPFPSSVLLRKNKECLPPKGPLEKYINGSGLSLTTSRNGLAPLFIWDYLIAKGLEDNIREALYSLDLA